MSGIETQLIVTITAIHQTPKGPLSDENVYTVLSNDGGGNVRFETFLKDKFLGYATISQRDFAKLYMRLSA